MGQIVAGVKEKLSDHLPGQIGSNARWSDSFIESLILSADYLMKEKLMNYRGTEVISLVADQSVYTLDQKFISVDRVEFASDGSDYDWQLYPKNLSDLDASNRRWRDNTGSRPETYHLLSAPGTPSSIAGAGLRSRIVIYRPLSSVTAETIRVYGNCVDSTTPMLSDDVQYKVHVPYVMAILKARENPQAAAEWWRKHVDGVEETRARYMGTYAAGRGGY